MKTVFHLICVAILCQNAWSQNWLTNDLTAYYPFDGNANDESGNGHHGQIAGAVSSAPDRFGVAGHAVRFTSTYGCINVYTPVFNIGQLEYTVAGCFCSDDAAKLYQNIFNTIPHWGLMLELNNEVVPNRVMFSTGTGLAWTDLYLTGAKTNFVNQVWQHLAFTKSGTNYTIYVNGQLDGQYAIPATAGYDYNVGYRFGAINSGDGNWQGFSGRLDDFRIYNRALSTGEVASLYAMDFPPEVNLVKACTVDFSNLIVGVSYQVQVSSDLTIWTNWGVPFTATSSNYTNSDYLRIADWSQRYFRLQQQ